jgi:hypothetical protein
MIHWLLRNNPNLLGDLLEERASGRSRAWYWRQVVVAVGRSIVDEARRHPVLTLRAAALASAVYCAALAITLFTYGILFSFLYPPMGESRWIFLLFSLEVVPALLAGWVLARTHRACIEPAICDHPRLIRCFGQADPCVGSHDERHRFSGRGLGRGKATIAANIGC